MKYFYPFIFLLAIVFAHPDMAAEKIYLPKVSWGENNAIDSVIKNVIKKCDSSRVYKDEIILVRFLEKNDTLMCYFLPTELKFLRSTKDMRGYNILDKRCFIFFIPREIQKRFKLSDRKKAFFINDPNAICDTDGIRWYYEIIGNSYREISVKEWIRRWGFW